MKKIILLGVLTSSLLFANKLSVLPMNPNELSVENGGTIPAIEAYTNGVEAIFTSKVELGINNKPLNELVFKYGEESKLNNTNLKNYIINNINDEKDIELANQLSNISNTVGSGIPIDGTLCDDNNIYTTNDMYVNGVCIGTTIEGTACNDNNTQTVNDIYHNGICIGTNIFNLAYSNTNITGNVGGYNWGSIWADAGNVAGIDNAILSDPGNDIFIIKTDKNIIVISNLRDNPYTYTSSVGPDIFYINGENMYNATSVLERIKALLGNEINIIHTWSSTSQALQFNKTYKVYKFKTNVLPLSEALKIRI